MQVLEAATGSLERAVAIYYEQGTQEGDRVEVEGGREGMEGGRGDVKETKVKAERSRGVIEDFRRKVEGTKNYMGTSNLESSRDEEEPKEKRIKLEEEDTEEPGRGRRGLEEGRGRRGRENYFP